MNEDRARAIAKKHMPGLLWALQLQAWKIDLRWTKLNHHVLGQARSMPRYQRATIEIDASEIDGEAELLATLRHELLHVVLAEFEPARDAACAIATTDEGRELLRCTWSECAERSVLVLEAMLGHGLGLDPLKLARKGAAMRQGALG